MNAFFRLLYRDMRAGVGAMKAVLIVQLVSPLIYIFVVGFAYSSILRDFEVGGAKVNYALFLAPGIIVIQIMTAATLAGATLWLDKRLGMFTQLMAGPFNRWQYLLSKLVAVMFQALLNVSLVFLFAAPLFIGLRITPQGILYTLGALVLGALFFGSLTLTASVYIKTNEAFNALLNILITPIMFLSSAFYPLEAAPAFLRAVSMANPLTYSANIVRAGLLGIYTTTLPLEIIVLILESLVMFAVATVSFRRMKI